VKEVVSRVDDLRVSDLFHSLAVSNDLSIDDNILH
jgi:hypothetical protein